MALERKDIRAKVDDDIHRALVAICRIDGVDIGEFVEQLIVPVVRKRISDAIELHDEMENAGIIGTSRSNQGAAGK